MTDSSIRLSLALDRPNPCRGRLLLALLGLGLSTAGGLSAQSGVPRALVSTTSDVSSFGFEDGHLLAVGGGQAPAPWFQDGHWLGTTGVRPSDVDAFAMRPGHRPGTARSIVFSLLADDKGLRDGDVLSVGPRGGVEVLFFEDDLTTALGAPGAAIDVDALDFDAGGALVFSLQNDLAASALGPIQDGDVLRLDDQGVASILFTEAEVGQMFTDATGSTAAIGDVQGIEFVGGEPWFLVQAPSSHDGGVLAGGPVPRMVMEESDVGLGGAELNALALLEPVAELPFLTMSTTAMTGGRIDLEITGTPGARALLLMSGSAGYVDWQRMGGFGAFLFDPNDPFFQRMLDQAFPVIQLDAEGRFEGHLTLFPQGLAGLGFCAEIGWTFQVVEFPTKRISAPFRVEEI